MCVRACARACVCVCTGGAALLLPLGASGALRAAPRGWLGPALRGGRGVSCPPRPAGPGPARGSCRAAPRVPSSASCLLCARGPVWTRGACEGACAVSPPTPFPSPPTGPMVSRPPGGVRRADFRLSGGTRGVLSGGGSAVRLAPAAGAQRPPRLLPALPTGGRSPRRAPCPRPLLAPSVFPGVSVMRAGWSHFLQVRVLPEGRGVSPRCLSPLQGLRTPWGRGQSAVPWRLEARDTGGHVCGRERTRCGSSWLWGERPVPPGRGSQQVCPNSGARGTDDLVQVRALTPGSGWGLRLCMSRSPRVAPMLPAHAAPRVTRTEGLVS